jgi:hypothetical protein
MGSAEFSPSVFNLFNAESHLASLAPVGQSDVDAIHASDLEHVAA